jgi:hypothetical protein
MSHVAAEPALTHCRNCGHALGEPRPNYCPSCGQETAPHPPTVWEFFHEYVLHYFAAEGKLWPTLGLLLFRPGELTRRYLIGQKRRYVIPLRLYLTASIIFFIVIKLAGAGMLVRGDAGDDTSAGQAISAMQQEIAGKEAVAADKTPAKIATQDGSAAEKSGSVAASEERRGVPEFKIKLGDASSSSGAASKPISLDAKVVDSVNCDGDNEWCQKIRQHFVDKYPTVTGREYLRILRDRALSLAPYAMLLFLPLFATLTYLLYRNRRMYYGEHMVYAFHVHTFAYIYLLSVAYVNPSVSTFIWLWGMIYFWLAQRRVFGGRWWATTMRYVVIATLYPLMLCTFVLLTMAVAVLF